MSQRTLAVVVLVALGVAALTFVEAGQTRFLAVWRTPAAGAYGTSFADLPLPAMRAKAHAEAEALHRRADWEERVSFACAALSLVVIVDPAAPQPGPLRSHGRPPNRDANVVVGGRLCS